MLLGRERIAAMIPHAGAMCLLDGVLRWDARSIGCVSRRYGEAGNPLRRADGRLGAACGIEIAGQAMAVHGRLAARADGEVRQGYLASVRDVRLGTRYLDAGDGEILVEARLLMGDSSGASYGFALFRDGVELVGGRATVLFEVAR
jgi:predicted hotdog family 3-hydroxylacyl-ACP dehydratase